MDLPVALSHALRSARAAWSEGRGPVNVPRSLTYLRDLPELYELEERNRWVDSALLAGSDVSHCFGSQQPYVPLSHRQSIIRWMCDATCSIGWSYPTLQTAVGIFDSYVSSLHMLGLCGAELDSEDRGRPPNPQRASTVLKGEDLPSLSAACLYLAACLRESMIDHNVISVYDFQRLCPEIGSAYVVRHYQLQILKRLTLLDQSFSNRTPYDLAVLFVHRMSYFKATAPLYHYMARSDALQHLIDTVMQVTTLCLLNGISLMLPGSSWVASTLLYMVEKCHSALTAANQSEGAENFHNGGVTMWLPSFEEVSQTMCNMVMEYPGGYEAVRRMLTLYYGIIRSAIDAINEAPTARGNQTAPMTPAVFRFALGQSSACSYRSPVVTQFRRLVLNTLSLIQHAVSSTQLPRVARELQRSATSQNEENAQPAWLARPLKAEDDARVHTSPARVFHIRRHTSACGCRRCDYYRHNPPDWRR